MTDTQALHEYATNRNAEAFRALVDQYQRLVYSAASRRLAHAEDIEDVVQVTFVKLAQAAGQFGAHLAAWLYTTTINTANDLIRRDQTRRRHESLAAPAESFVYDAEREEWHKLSLLIDEVLLELPEPQQSLIVEHFLNRRSQRDLAEELNVSQPTILRRIDAAVDELRQRLADRGYGIAAPALASAFDKLPQPNIPASLTIQLTKVGLSGVYAGSVSGPVLVGNTLWIKIGLAVISLAAVFAGAIELLSPSASPQQASAVPTSQPAIAATNPTDWRTTFYSAYALQSGQNLKFIPPPPLPERQRYLLEVEHNDSPMPFIQWRWIKGILKREWMEGSGPNGAGLGMVLAACAKLDEHHSTVEGLTSINADGDWIVRDGASAQAILTDLQIILHDQFNVDMKFEKNEVTKDALIVSGKYHFHRIPDATLGHLQIYADVLDHPKLGDSVEGGGVTSPADLWSMLGTLLGIPMIDEAKGEPRNINWLLSHSIVNADHEPDRRQQILDNITKQTGLVFKQEPRVFVTWKLSPAQKDKKN